MLLDELGELAQDEAGVAGEVVLQPAEVSGVVDHQHALVRGVEEPHSVAAEKRRDEKELKPLSPLEMMLLRATRQPSEAYKLTSALSPGSLTVLSKLNPNFSSSLAEL